MLRPHVLLLLIHLRGTYNDMEAYWNKYGQQIMFGVIGFILLVFLLGSGGLGFKVVDTGHRGLKVQFGKVIGEPLPEGLHFYIPFVQNVINLEVREQKIEGVAESFTKDTQQVRVEYAVVLFPDPKFIGDMYIKFGTAWREKLVGPAIQSSIKDIIGQYVADDLVGKRDQARVTAQEELTRDLAARNIMVTSLAFTNLDFDDAYERAVEAKVVAIQRALEEKNKTTQVEEQARQITTRAKAEAEAMRIKTQALERNVGLVQYEAVQKWDGKLPQYMMGGGALPFIQMK